MKAEARKELNRQLKMRGWRELPDPSIAAQDLAGAVDADNARRPSPRRDDRTQMEIMEDELIRRGFRPPRDAA